MPRRRSAVDHKNCTHRAFGFLPSLTPPQAPPRAAFPNTTATTSPATTGIHPLRQQHVDATTTSTTTTATPPWFAEEFSAAFYDT